MLDVLVHRQLAAAINYSPLHASLHSKDYTERVTDTANRRHRMAQMASRASVEFYVGLALQSRGANAVVGVQEDAFIIRTFRNGVGVFIYRCGFILDIFNCLILTYDWLDSGLKGLSHSNERSSSIPKPTL